MLIATQKADSFYINLLSFLLLSRKPAIRPCFNHGPLKSLLVEHQLVEFPIYIGSYQQEHLLNNLHPIIFINTTFYLAYGKHCVGSQ